MIPMLRFLVYSSHPVQMQRSTREQVELNKSYAGSTPSRYANHSLHPLKCLGSGGVSCMGIWDVESHSPSSVAFFPVSISQAPLCTEHFVWLTESVLSGQVGGFKLPNHHSVHPQKSDAPIRYRLVLRQACQLTTLDYIQTPVAEHPIPVLASIKVS